MTDRAEFEGTSPSTSRAVREDAPRDLLRALCLADPVFAERYEGWEELGRGTFATVVRTHLRDAGVPVALKIFWRMAPAERRQLRAEAEALMSVAHPAVVRTFAVFARSEPAWFELELVEGTTLGAELRAMKASGERCPLERALEIGACLAEGLAAVHAAGFVHRDVKPDNVLLPRGGQPAAKLGDFGIARSVDATMLLGEEMPGSPKYMCPEALRGQGVGPAGDVYALALTLYQLFSGGRYPFALRRQASLAETLDCHRRKAPMPLRTLGLGLPDGVVDVIQHGLDKQPSHRPTATDVARVLRAAQAGEPAAGVWAPRRRRLSLIAALAAGAVLGGGLVSAAAWLLLR